MKLKDKVVLVTGAGGGVGRALVLELTRRKARVFGVDVSEKGLRETASIVQAEGGSFESSVVDITDRAAVGAVPAHIEKCLGAADGIINCAGIIQPFVKIADMDYSTIDRVFGVNWSGTLHVVKAFLPVLLERPEAHIVNVSSMGGFLPVPGQSVYGASKAAVKLFTEGLRAELADTQIGVTVVLPGAVATNIKGNSGLKSDVADAGKMQRITQPDSAARAILDGVERNKFRVLIGSDAKLLDALYRLSPERASGLIARKMKNHVAPQQKS